MNKSLIALTIAGMSLLGCSRDYKEYNIDGNEIRYSRTEPVFPILIWEIIETKNDSIIIKYNFLETSGERSHFFKVQSNIYYSSDTAIYNALNKRLDYLLHKIDSIDKAEESELIKRINE